MASKKQIKANRKNAKKGGVKSAEGKNIVRFNALKHGILSQAVFIDNGEGKEDEREFTELGERLAQELQPVGLVEEMLVDRILTSYWRLRRVIYSEVGEIRSRQDNLIFNKILKRIDDFTQHKKLLSVFSSELLKSSLGIQHLIDLTKEAENEVKSENSLSADTEELLFKYFGDEENSFAMTAAVMNSIMKNEEVDDEKCPVPPEKAKEGFLLLAKKEKGRLRSLLELFEKKERLEDENSFLATSIPSRELLDKITRYEVSLERSMYKALHELQRLQSMRRGEKPPAPVAIDIDISKD